MTFIAVEGIDGAGKRTCVESVVTLARRRGYSSEHVSFPRYGETLISESITEFLREKKYARTSNRALAAIYAAERLESLEYIRDLIQDNDLVVADRFVASNVVYQAARAEPEDQALLMSWIDRLEHEVFELPRPSLYVWLAIDPSRASLRAAARLTTHGRPNRDRNEADKPLLRECDRLYRILSTGSTGSRWITYEDEDLEVAPTQLAEQILNDLQTSGFPRPACL